MIEKIARPTIVRMAERGTPFVGVLFCGLAVTSRGVRVIEFNARFGDPETQAVLARLRTPLGQLLLRHPAARSPKTPAWNGTPAPPWMVVMAAENYPGTPRKSDAIAGLENASNVPGVHVVHAGTAVAGEEIVTAGGRVLAVVALGDNPCPGSRCRLRRGTSHHLGRRTISH